MHARLKTRVRRGAALLLVVTAAVAVTACGGSSDSAKTGTAPTASTSTDTSMTSTDAVKDEAPNGKTIFGNQCSVCHGVTGSGGNGGPPINQGKTKELVIKQVTNGGGGMPPFSGQLSEAEITAVADHVMELQK